MRKMNCTLITVSSDAPCCAGRADEAAAAAPLMERCTRLLLYPSCSADICASTASLLEQCQGYCWPLMRFLSSLLTGPDEIHQLLKRAKKRKQKTMLFFILIPMRTLTEKCYLTACHFAERRLCSDTDFGWLNGWPGAKGGIWGGTIWDQMSDLETSPAKCCLICT